MRWLRDSKVWSLANMVYDKTYAVPPKNSFKSFVFEFIRKKREYDDKVRLLISCRSNSSDIGRSELQEVLLILGTPFYSYKEAMGAETQDGGSPTLSADYFDFINNKRGKT